MTGKEIIKKLQEILETMCYEGDLQTDATVGNALDLINRQKEKLEISKTKLFKRQLKKELHRLTVEKIKAEAIKDFAERLCEDRVPNDPVVIAVKTEMKFMIGEKE